MADLICYFPSAKRKMQRMSTVDCPIIQPEDVSLSRNGYEISRGTKGFIKELQGFLRKTKGFPLKLCAMSRE